MWIRNDPADPGVGLGLESSRGKVILQNWNTLALSVGAPQRVQSRELNRALRCLSAYGPAFPGLHLPAPLPLAESPRQPTGRKDKPRDHHGSGTGDMGLLDVFLETTPSLSQKFLSELPLAPMSIGTHTSNTSTSSLSRAWNSAFGIYFV